MPDKRYEPPKVSEEEFEPREPWTRDNYLALIMMALGLAFILTGPYLIDLHYG